MGISKPIIKLIASDLNATNVNKGSIVTYGVQGIDGDYISTLQLLENEGYKVTTLNEKDIVYDDLTQYGNTIHQSTLFKMLGFSHVDSIDLWDDEKPTIIHDLNIPIPDVLKSRYDIVYDGGTSEHVFNQFEIFSNGIKLLKPGGIIMHHLPISGLVNHGFFQFSPTLFFDFYSINKFEIVSVNVLCKFNGNQYLIPFPSNESIHELALSRFRCLSINFVARKLENITDITIPTQGHYKDGIITDQYAWLNNKNIIIKYLFNIKKTLNQTNKERFTKIESIYQFYKFFLKNLSIIKKL